MICPSDCEVIKKLGYCSKKLCFEPHGIFDHYIPEKKNNTNKKYKIEWLITDAVVVVRCKNCIYSSEHYDRNGYPSLECSIWDADVDADGYCYRGDEK